jgi:hypothetical protein
LVVGAGTRTQRGAPARMGISPSLAVKRCAAICTTAGDMAGEGRSPWVRVALKCA